MRLHCFTGKTLLLLVALMAVVFVDCNKDDDNPQPTEIKDFDGNVYTSVTIGTQTWMVENLKTTHYNDGTPIPIVDYTHWESNTDGASCHLNDNAANTTTFGLLYDFYAVNTGKLAPAGWHVPTDAEWQTLIDFVGGEAVAGGKLKEAGTTHWIFPNTGATDEFGFHGLPGFWRLHSAATLATSGENLNGRSAHFWTSTPHTVADFARHRSFFYDTQVATGVEPGDIAYKYIGMSVRCIKD